MSFFFLSCARFCASGVGEELRGALGHLKRSQRSCDAERGQLGGVVKGFATDPEARSTLDGA